MANTQSSRFQASRPLASGLGISPSKAAQVIQFPAPAYQQQSASEGFFWLVMGLAFAGAAIVYAAHQMGLL